MTVPSSANRSGPYNGNGVTTFFNYGFRILDENHLTVIKTVGGVETVLTIDADYVVSDVGADAGGQIAVTPAPAVGSTITILRNVPFTQETDLENQGAYFAETIEGALDRGVMRDQQLSERLDRTVTIPASADGSTLDALIEDVLRLADSADAIDTVAGISGAVTTVAGISANVTTVAGIAANVTTVAGVAASVSAVAAVDDEVAAVAGNAANINAVAGIGADVSTVAGAVIPVSTVATDIAAVVDASINMAAIVAAPDQAAAAAASADAAAATLASSLLKANNLSDLTDPAVARTNLGLADVATSGSYSDLADAPVLGSLSGKNSAEISDINASGAPSVTTYLRGDGSWQTPSGGGAITAPQGRLTLTSGTAVTTADVAGATTVYYTPATGNNVPLYDGSVTSMVALASQLSLALDATSGHTGYHQSGKIFDLFVFNDSGTLRLGTGPAWSSDSARGTGAGTTELELKNGFWTNKVSATLRYGSSSGNTLSAGANSALYVGSFYATANGQASDTKLNRSLFNAYNQTLRTLLFTKTGTWVYSTATFRWAGADANAKVNFLVGLAGGVASFQVNTVGRNQGGTAVNLTAGIGINSTSTNSATANFPATSANNQVLPTSAFYEDFSPIGYNYAAWLESGGGSSTQDWFNGSIKGLVSA